MSFSQNAGSLCSAAGYRPETRGTGSASATFRAFHAQGLRFPCRPPHGPHQGELLWQALTYSRALDVLHNPRYAGAYVLGRTRQRKRGDGRRITRDVPRKDWPVLLPDTHKGYISWDEFEQNQGRLQANNWRTRGSGGTTPPREGSALLQGVALCQEDPIVIGQPAFQSKVFYRARQGLTPIKIPLFTRY